MRRHLTPRAVNRAQWFSELSAALDEGERVLAELIAAQISPAETEELRLRLVALRGELGRVNRFDPAEQRVVGMSWPDGAVSAMEPMRPIHPDWGPLRD